MEDYSPSSLYEIVAAALQCMDCDVDAAECHGMLCGMLCRAERFDAAAWFEHLNGYADSVPAGIPAAEHPLWEMLRRTVQGMDADDYSFQLLLPEDDESLAERAGALGAWCRGFLSGFGAGAPATALSAESREFLTDVFKISQVDPEDAGGAAGEQAYFEIVEYTRMGAILLHEENRLVLADAIDATALH